MLNQKLSGLTIVIALGLAIPAFAADTKTAPPSTTPSTGTEHKDTHKDAAKITDASKVKQQIKTAVKFPATKEQIVTAINSSKDIVEADKKVIQDTLPSATYKTAEDVYKALGIEK